MQALYQWQINDCPWQDLVQEFAAAEDMERADAEYFRAIVGAVCPARDAFDELLLVAPARALHELREALDTATAAKLVGTLEKDLVKTPDHELSPHLRDWVSPERRPSV